MRPQVRGVPLTECRDCAEPIRFVHLNTGTSIPVNPGAGDGPIAAWKIGRDLHGQFITPKTTALPTGFLRFTPHAATCTERARSTPPPAPDDPALF